MTLAISARNVVKSFGQGASLQRVLDGTEFQLKTGEFVAIMGASGSGKSTLLYALSGMDSIDSGTVCFGDTELSQLSEEGRAALRLSRMGFIFQQASLLKNLNLLDNILLPALQRQPGQHRQLTQRAETLMQQVGIGGLGHRMLSQVSGGQLQRAALCRALMQEPAVLFADEPTGALNSQTSDEIMTLLVTVQQRGTAIVLVTHDPRVAARAQRVVFLKDGRVVAEWSADRNPNITLDERTQQIMQHMKQVQV